MLSLQTHKARGSSKRPMKLLPDVTGWLKPPETPNSTVLSVDRIHDSAAGLGCDAYSTTSRW